MSQPVISVEGLGKRYTLHHQARSGLLRDRLAGLLRNPFLRAKTSGTTNEDFWALRDVNFSVNQGDVVGIIGRNGAGKSTLLKILSRITEPTTGRITINGRIASLLEVGTGFHGELSGRENIFLNGAILGMKRAEIRKKFDEIVAFAEVEKFLDTPVKHYSSGMYVRLAFAVAAHLEPEILIIDEVLAVGDTDFQRKCLKKMDDVTRRDGRTILFVSHQLQAVQQLCNRVLILQKGCLIHDTSTPNGIALYTAQSSSTELTTRDPQFGQELVLSALHFSPSPITVFQDLKFILQLDAQQSCTIHDLCLLIYNEFGQRAAIADLRSPSGTYKLEAGQCLNVEGCFQRLGLVTGRYAVGLFLKTNNYLNDRLPLQYFEVQPGESRVLINYPQQDLGVAAIDVVFSPHVTKTNNCNA